MAFIVRIDKRGTHAWQVRGAGRRGYASKLFSDLKYGGREEALKLAQAYKEELNKIDPPLPRPGSTWRDSPNAANSSGVNGVFRTHHYHGQTGQKQEYWGAFVPIGPYGGRYYFKRFYINDERDEDEAFRLAVEYRKMWEEAAREGEQAIRRFFADYESGYL
jgi:hypothetical protein